MSDPGSTTGGGTPPQHSLAEIQSAIEAVMSRLSGGKSYDASLAATIAGSIHVAVNDPRNGLGALAGNPAFERMVTEQAPKLAETLNDPAAQLAAARAEQSRANISGAPISESARVALGMARAHESRTEGQSQSRGTERAASADFGSINANNYAHSPFAASGLSYSTFASLRALGFNETNIIHAAQDTRANGFDVNNKKVVGAFAVLDKEDGQRRDERNRLLEKFDHRLEHDEAFQSLKAQRDQAQGQQRKALEDQMAARGREISKEIGLRGHIDAAPTQKGREAGEIIEGEKIKLKGAINEYSHGNKAEAEHVKDVVAEYRRNPQDAKARSNYEALQKKAVGNTEKFIGVKKIAEELRKADGLSDKKLAQNEAKKQSNDVKNEKLANNQAEDDIFGSMMTAPPNSKASDLGTVRNSDTAMMSQDKAPETKAADAKDASTKLEAKDEKPKENVPTRPTPKVKVATSSALKV